MNDIAIRVGNLSKRYKNRWLFYHELFFSRTMVYIIMGVSGCGKTTIGKMLAEKIGITFYDADDFHSQNNINKMKNLIPLSEEDRTPWLLNLAQHVVQWNRDEGAVLACSALKEKYRQILSSEGKEEVTFIYLEGDKDIILERMKGRKAHFFSTELLDSQFDALEAPSGAISVRIDKPQETICREIVDRIVFFNPPFDNATNNVAF